MTERDDVERDRLEAQLALTSKAPDSLEERIRARRARGDRVSLPVPPTSRASAAPWRRALAPIGIAAAAALAIVAAREWLARPEEAPPPPVDVSTGFESPDGRYPSGTVFVSTLTEWRESAVDSAARIVAGQPNTRVDIRYSGEGVLAAPRARALADSVATALERRGVPRASMSVAAGPASFAEPPLPTRAVRIVVRSTRN